MATNPIDKYRPVLSSSQILHICKLARADVSEESLSVLGVMSLYAYKISQGIIEPAYSEAPKASLVDSLGFGESGSPPEQAELTSYSPHSPESLYNQWLENPEPLTVDDLKRVQFYRYNNGKMTPDQERKYEAETLGV